MTQNPSKRNRWLVIMIAFISFLPIALAWYAKQNPQWLTAKSNYGHLIIPPRPLSYDELFAQAGSSAESMEIKGRWVLVQTVKSVCSEACQDALYKTRQIRLMLNREIFRVRRLLLTPVTDAEALKDQLKDETLLLLGVSPALQKKLEDAIGQSIDDGTVLIMDPLGNLMMWYEPGFDPYGAVKDLQHLLNASQIG